MLDSDAVSILFCFLQQLNGITSTSARILVRCAKAPNCLGTGYTLAELAEALKIMDGQISLLHGNSQKMVGQAMANFSKNLPHWFRLPCTLCRLFTKMT